MKGLASESKESRGLAGSKWEEAFPGQIKWGAAQKPMTGAGSGEVSGGEGRCPPQVNRVSCYRTGNSPSSMADGPAHMQELQENPRESHAGQQASQPVLSAGMRQWR